MEVSQDPGARAHEADERIAQRLREIDYDLAHPHAQQLADHLHALGVGTLVNMKRTNTLFQECRKLNIRGLPPPPDSWHNESQRLIVVAVRMAKPRFITSSMPKWDPAKSAIDTYFVNYCLFEFKKVYIEYCKEESKFIVERPTDNVIAMIDTRVAEGGVAEMATDRQTLREVTKLIGSEEFAEYVRLTAKGLTRAQTAAALGISISTLDRRVAEYRQKFERGGWTVRRGR